MFITILPKNSSIDSTVISGNIRTSGRDIFLYKIRKAEHWTICYVLNYV